MLVDFKKTSQLKKKNQKGAYTYIAILLYWRHLYQREVDSLRIYSDTYIILYGQHLAQI